MAISDMKRVDLILHRSLRDEAIALLQDAEVMEITSENQIPEDLELKPCIEDSVGEIEEEINQVRRCLEFIQKYRQQKPKGWFLTPIEVSKDNFTHPQFNYLPIYQACVSIENQLQDIRNRVNRVNSHLEFLKRIEKMDIPLEDVGETRFTHSYLLEITEENWVLFKERLQAIGKEWYLNEFKGEGRSVLAFLVIYRDLLNSLEEIFADLSISPLSLPQAFEGTPRQVILKLEERKKSLAEKEQVLITKGAIYQKYEDQLKILFDYYNTLWEKRQTEAKIWKTDQTCLISGWVKEENLPDLEQALAKEKKEWVLYQRDPQPGEDVPIYLENHPWVENFDILTRLYGLPNYTEVDPTPFMAGFFFFFFGICLGDVIYGLAIALLGFGAAYFLPAPLSTKRFIKMLAWGGVASLVMGLFTGSWLGDLFDYLPSSLAFLNNLRSSLMVIDPLNNPLPMLIFALGIGIIQILLGILLGFYKEWRRGNYGKAVLDHLSWFIFITTIVVYLLSMVAIPTIQPVVLPILVGAVLFLIATQGRHQKNPIMKVLSGLLSLYNLVSYLGDVLSYSRLFALGISTTIIAVLARTLGSLFGGAPYIGWLIGLVVALVFHLFNLGMSGLGAFVHSVRLQYVEFFTKFYENGGHEFKPFRYKTKYIKLH